MNTLKKLVILFFIVAIAYGCQSDSNDSSGGNSDGSTVTDGNTVAVSGSIPSDLVSYQIKASQKTLWTKLINLIQPEELIAAGEKINKVLAISNNGEVNSGTVSADGSFSISLVPGSTYFLGFFADTTFKYAYAYSADSLDSLPLQNVTADLKLGDLKVNGTKIEPSASPSTDLNLSAEELAVISQFDQALWRFSNADVDNDGVMDFEQNRYYSFFISYNFESISGIGLASIKNLESDIDTYDLQGYMFYAPIHRSDIPEDKFVDGDDYKTGGPVATLTPPGPGFTTLNSGSSMQTGDDEDCYQRYESSDNGRTGYFYNFHCGENNVLEPANTPSGSYVIRLYDGYRTAEQETGVDGTATRGSYTADELIGGWATEYTFTNVPSVTVGTREEAPKPMIKVNTSGDQIVSIDFTWKKHNGTSWVNMTDNEVNIYTGGQGLSISLKDESDNRWRFNALGAVASGNYGVSELSDDSYSSTLPNLADLTYLRASYPDFTNLGFGIEFRPN